MCWICESMQRCYNGPVEMEILDQIRKKAFSFHEDENPGEGPIPRIVRKIAALEIASFYITHSAIAITDEGVNLICRLITLECQKELAILRVIGYPKTSKEYKDPKTQKTLDDFVAKYGVDWEHGSMHSSEPTPTFTPEEVERLSKLFGESAP